MFMFSFVVHECYTANAHNDELLTARKFQYFNTVNRLLPQFLTQVFTPTYYTNLRISLKILASGFLHRARIQRTL